MKLASKRLPEVQSNIVRMEFKDFILERFSPVVMVISSPDVDAMVGEANGLTVPDLLRPHGFLRNLSGESTLPSRSR